MGVSTAGVSPVRIGGDGPAPWAAEPVAASTNGAVPAPTGPERR